jgi:alpha-beta hydrolase superfamily lysophospholipase
MRIEKVSFLSQGQAVAGALHLPEVKNPPCVIASHGLFSSKDSDKYVTLGERCTRKGIAFLRFDFRGFGESGGSMAESTVSPRLMDLNMAIEFVRSHPRIAPGIGLMGSSLGGYISLLKAATGQDIRAVVTWATPFTLAGLEQRRGEGEMALLGEEFFHDIKAHDLAPALPKVANCLVIHGDRDELVPVEQAKMIYEGLNYPKGIEIIEEADHRLTQPDHREKTIEMTVEWFERYFEH